MSGIIIVASHSWVGRLSEKTGLLPLLILDEATEGLSPLVRQEIWAALGGLRKEGMAILVIDKNIVPMLALADYHYVIEKGQVVWHGRSEKLKAAPEIYHKYLGA